MKALGAFTAGAPKVLIYTIKQYYKNNKISIVKLKIVYIRSFIFSHVRSLLYILAILYIYPHLCDFASSAYNIFGPMMTYFEFIENLYKSNVPTCITDMAIANNISIQIATLSHTINFGFRSLESLNLKYEDLYDKATSSGGSGSIPSARQTRGDIVTARERLMSNIMERNSLIERGASLHPSWLYHKFGELDNTQRAALDISLTLTTSRKWEV